MNKNSLTMSMVHVDGQGHLSWLAGALRKSAWPNFSPDFILESPAGLVQNWLSGTQPYHLCPVQITQPTSRRHYHLCLDCLYYLTSFLDQKSITYHDWAAT